MAEQELKVYVPESGVATIRRIPLPAKREDREEPALQFQDMPIRHIPDYLKVSPEARKFALRDKVLHHGKVFAVVDMAVEIDMLRKHRYKRNRCRSYTSVREPAGRFPPLFRSE